MNGKDILLGMSFISDELVQEADSQPIKSIIPWRKWLPLAACLGLIIGAATVFSALMPGMERDRQESAVLDNELSATSRQPLTEAGQESSSAVNWNSATASPLLTAAPGSTVTYTYGDSLPESTDALQLYKEQAEPFLYRSGIITVGNMTYFPDSWESTWISGKEVQLFSADSGTLLARFVIPCSETEYLLVTTVSDSLSEDRFLQAITEIIEEQGDLP